MPRVKHRIEGAQAQWQFQNMKTHTENPPSPTDTAQPVVLVAEDDEQIGFLLQFLLEREGYRVLLAHDGLEVQRLIEEIAPPRLAILDIMMPYADGFELLALIRAKPDWQATPVIMLTARSQEKDIVRALDMGASDYVVKPFLPEELKARIRRLVPLPE
jgi:DNA-binding response OmpR family regulator